MSTERERRRRLGTVTGSSCYAPNNRAVVFTGRHLGFTIYLNNTQLRE